MSRMRYRSGLVLIVVVVAVAGAGFIGVPRVGAEVNDSFDPGDTLGFSVGNFAVAPEPGFRIGPDSVWPREQVQALAELETQEPGDYDPWESFNEKMFNFNHDILDRFVLKPVATAWNKVVPETVQRHLKNAIYNLGMPRRFVNNLLQGKVQRAGLELTRFIFNTTAGIGGFFDVATVIDVEKVPDEDTGQTFGVWGAGPGPYLVLPFLPPLDVRDGIGFGIDGLLDPLNYFIPFAATAGRTAVNTVNERSLNLELFQDVEEGTIDLYSAVRNGYLQRRQKLIEE